jgi:hypothetical protein
LRGERESVNFNYYENSQPLLTATVATLFWVSVTGCQSSSSNTASTAAATAADTTSTTPTGPAAKAVMLSDKKTFDIVGRTASQITYSKPEGPEADVITDAVRNRLGSLGYQYQTGSPDFVISVAWDESQKIVQPSPADTQTPVQTSATVAIDQATLGFTVRDTITGKILWQSPTSDPMDPKMVSADQARGLTTVALKDFPPAQPATASK